MSTPAAALRDDLLTGAAEISKYTGLHKRKIYYAADRQYLPITRMGQTLIARKSELDRALSGASDKVAA